MPYFRNILVLYTTLCLLQTIHSQGLPFQYIKLPPQELSVEQYLDYLQKTTGYNLAFSYTIVENRKIIIMADSLPIHKLLDTLFTKTKVEYFLRENTLIFAPVNELNVIENAIKITGKIVDSKNGKPISYASVYSPQSSIGTISNIEGNFELNFSADVKLDTIEVSCIGYKIYKFPVAKNIEQHFSISLVSTSIKMDEIIVRPQNPIELITNCVAQKTRNYSSQPNFFTGFFREASKQNENYINLSEAVIDIYKTPYNNAEPDLIRLKKGRKGSNAKQVELVNLVVEGGLYNGLQLDIMKYGVSFLDPDFLNCYNYNLANPIIYQGRLTYVIKFNFKNNSPITGFDGEIFLDIETLALVRANFEINSLGMHKAAELLVKKVPANYRVNPKFARYNVEYRYYDSVWNLMQARSEIELLMKKKNGKDHKGFVCNYYSRAEFVITGKTIGQVERIKYKDASKPNDILFEQITSTDPDYWGNETIIIPEEPLEITLEKLKIPLSHNNIVIGAGSLK